jgi:hypothetical protein
LGKDNEEMANNMIQQAVVMSELRKKVMRGKAKMRSMKTTNAHKTNALNTSQSDVDEIRAENEALKLQNSYLKEQVYAKNEIIDTKNISETDLRVVISHLENGITNLKTQNDLLRMADNMEDDEITHLKKMRYELVTALDRQKDEKNVEIIKTQLMDVRNELVIKNEEITTFIGAQTNLLATIRQKC